MRLRRKPPEQIPPEVLLEAYSRGAFPMADERTGRIQWCTADPRAILPLDPLHVPRRLVRALRKREFAFSRDEEFETVIRACADRDSTWISEGIVASYRNLHRLGFAHSVEVWEGGELVGGLYGVQLRGAFFGESMFNRTPDASKAALIHLAQHLRARGIELLEVQMVTSLTALFAPRLVPQDEYLGLLAHAMAQERTWD
jgi:leucyl/phenylalanyl-tRNA--protein transferase